jgi:UDP-N-acetylglucosamine 2-epimerase (non-hydrolysing)/GDP/UDP-N,N'-diacetylbacillosamine 2-epimerase (hydrolysing)
MSSRKIALVTGGRADFGHLAGLAHAIAKEPALELQLVATGTHLSAAHGMTVSEIEREGLPVAARVDIGLGSGSGADTARSVGRGTIGFADAFEALKPDLVCVLGDRFEILAACSAALVMSIPVVHIHGGEVSTGSFDDSVRHAVSKMASLHLVAAEPYRQRLVQMGEQPERVFNFGSPALEALRDLPLMPREALERELGISLRSPLVAMTFHPATRSVQGALAEMEALLAALDQFPDTTVIVTGTNSDPEGEALRAAIRDWVGRNAARAHHFESLGRLRYASLLAAADAMIGNSSSGYIEAPAFGLPVVDVGDRQTGRLAAAHIQRVAADSAEIVAALCRALDPDYRATLASQKSAYGTERFSERAVELLKTIALGPDLLRKAFRDEPGFAVPLARPAARIAG